MARDDAIGLRGLHFALQIDGITQATFQSVEGIGSHTEVVESREVDTKGKIIIRKIPGAVKWDDITFRRGTCNSQELRNWRKLVEDGKIDEARKNVSIVVYAPDEREVARWNLTAAWPVALRVTNLNSTNNELSVEEMTVTHEGLERPGG
jgi:phage tail-like protein